jgi:hypothetical protein
MPRSPKGERHAPPRSPLRPPCPRAVMHSKNPGNNLTPNCVTITEPACDRKEQKFGVPRSARIARQDSRLGCRQIPAQAFHDQSVDLLKELLRDSDVYLALRIDELREHDNVWIPVSPLPHLFRRFAGQKSAARSGDGQALPARGLKSGQSPAGAIHSQLTVSISRF